MRREKKKSMMTEIITISQQVSISYFYSLKKHCFNFMFPSPNYTLYFHKMSVNEDKGRPLKHSKVSLIYYITTGSQAGVEVLR